MNENYLFQKKIELLIDTTFKKVKNELDALKNMIAQLDANISEIKRGYSGNTGGQPEIRANEVVEEPTKSQQINIREQVTVSEYGARDVTNVLKSSQQEKAKPRYGDYQPEDVPIDKFFYFGGNKSR